MAYHSARPQGLRQLFNCIFHNEPCRISIVLSWLNEPDMIQVSKPEFSIGKLLATPAAIEALEEANVTALVLVARHVNKDWGDLSDDDKRLNDEALHDGSRILSAYILAKTSVKIWIITEAADDDGDRAATTVLLPEEY